MQGTLELSPAPAVIQIKTTKYSQLPLQLSSDITILPLRRMLSHRTCLLLTITFALMSCLVGSFKIPRLTIQRDFSLKASESGSYSSEETVTAMENARACAANGLSPGAGLATADEQAEVYLNRMSQLQPIRCYQKSSSQLNLSIIVQRQLMLI